jgi:hypothetical protein
LNSAIAIDLWLFDPDLLYEEEFKIPFSGGTDANELFAERGKAMLFSMIISESSTSMSSFYIVSLYKYTANW